MVLALWCDTHMYKYTYNFLKSNCFERLRACLFFVCLFVWKGSRGFQTVWWHHSHWLNCRTLFQIVWLHHQPLAYPVVGPHFWVFDAVTVSGLILYSGILFQTVWCHHSLWPNSGTPFQSVWYHQSLHGLIVESCFRLLDAVTVFSLIVEPHFGLPDAITVCDLMVELFFRLSDAISLWLDSGTPFQTAITVFSLIVEPYFRLFDAISL